LLRVLVVDDSLAFRRFVCRILEHKQDLQLVGEVSDGLEAVQKAEELQPDLILLDVGLPTLKSPLLVCYPMLGTARTVGSASTLREYNPRCFALQTGGCLRRLLAVGRLSMTGRHVAMAPSGFLPFVPS
jgi:CheY-like chemotaxis protein